MECAIMMPLLFIIVFATIDFSLYLLNRNVVENAARYGARLHALESAEPLSDDEIESLIRERNEGLLVNFDGPKAFDIDLFAETLHDTVFHTVTVSYTYNCLFISYLLNRTSLDIRISSTMAEE